MKENQTYSNPFMNGLENNPSTEKKPTNPIDPVLESFNRFKDNRIPTTDDLNKGIDLTKYQKYLGDTFVYTGASNRERAVKQSGIEQAGNAVLRLLPNTALEFIRMAANTLDVEDYVNTDNEVGNWLNTWAQNQKNIVNQALPIYRQDPGKALDVSDPAWWFENGTNLVQSAAAFVGLGYLTGAASVGAISRGTKTLEWLKSLNNTIPNFTRNMSAVTSSVLLNQAEGIDIAVSAYKTQYDKELRRLQSDETMVNNNTPEQLDNLAKQKASQSAVNALNFNRINILSNLTSAELLLKTPTLTRQALEAPSVMKSLRRVGLEGIQEFSEEEINDIAELKQDNPNYTLEDALAHVFSREGIESGMWGFLGGALQTGFTYAGRELPTQKFEGRRVSENYLQRQRFADQQTAKARWDTLSKAEKMQSATDAFLTLQEQSELINEIQTANNNKDYKKANELRDKLLVNQATHAFNTGTTEQLLNTYLSFANLSEDQAAEKGIYNGEEKDIPSYYKNQAKKAINTIETLERYWNDSRQYLNQEPIYNEDGNIRWNGVFSNRAESVQIKNNLESLKGIKDDYRKSIEGFLSEVGVENDAFQFSPTTGELNLVDVSNKDYRTNLEELSAKELKEIAKDKKIPKYYAKNKETLINDLVESNENSKNIVKEFVKTNEYKGYNGILEVERTLKNRQKDLGSEYVNLTSDSTQRDIKAYYKGAVQSKRKAQQEEKVTKAKTEVTTKKNIKKKKYNSEAQANTVNSKVTTPPVSENNEGTENTSTQFTQPTTTSNPNIDANGRFQFTAFPDIEDNNNYSLVVNANNMHPDQRKKFLGELIKAVKEESNIDKKDLANIINEANLAIKYLEDVKKGEVTPNTAKTNMDRVAEELADRLESDLSPAIKEETEAQKRRKKAELMLDLIEEAELQGIADFKSLAIWMNGKIGSDRFSKIFIPFQDLYNGVKTTGDRATFEYTDIFATDKDKQDFVDNDNTSVNNSLPFGVYTVDHNNLDDIHESTIRNLAQQNSLDTDSKTFDYGDKEDGVFKVVEGHNKIAYLARNWIRIFEVDKNGNIKVRKTDVDDNINDIGESLLDYSILKEGSEITFIPINEVTLENGDIIKSDGTIQHLDGTIEERNSQEIAPIAIMYNGQLLKGAYLHVPEWINEESISGDVENDREQLIELRRNVLNAGEKGLTTKITGVSPGWLMESKDGLDLTANSLPDVDTFAINRDNKFNTSIETTIDVLNSEGKEGTISAIVPVSDTAKMAIHLNRLSMSTRYSKSIRRAVELFVNGVDTNIVDQLEKEHGINILSVEGIRDYISRFVFIYNKFEGNTDKFKNYLLELPSNVHLLRVTGNGIEFGTGQGIQFNAISKNSPKEHLNTFLDKLEKHLNKMYMNFELERLGTEDFILPIIEDGIVKGKKQSYNDHIKNHTQTKYFSITTESGKPIYTIQRTLEFDTKGLVESKEEQELKSNVVGEETITSEAQSILDNNDYRQGDIEIIQEDTNTSKNNIILAAYKASLMYKGDSFASVLHTVKLGNKNNNTLGEQRRINNFNTALNEIVNESKPQTRTITSPSGKKFTISVDDVPPPDASPKIIEDTQFQNIISGIPSNVYIPNMSFMLQNSVIDYITSDVLSRLVIDKETMASQGMLDEYINYFREIREAYAELGNESMANLAQQVLDNSTDIINIVTSNLAKMDTVDIDLVQLEDEISNEGVETVEEKQRFDSEAIFKENPVSSLTKDIKKYLSAIYDMEIDSAGNLVNKKTIFGLDKVVPFDIVINDLYSILANTNEEYVPPVFDIMLDEIKKNIELKPYLSNVLMVMKDAPQNIKSEFTTAMSKHYTHHRYIYRLYDRSTKSYSLKPLNSDNFSNENKVKQDWLNRLKKSKYIANNSNILEELVVINQDEISEGFKDIQDKFKEGKSVVTDLKNWLNTIGVKIPDTILTRIKNKGLFVDGARRNFDYLINNPLGVFNLINKNLTERDNEATIIENNPFKDKAVGILAREVAKNLNNIYSNSFSDVRGETYFGYSPNKYFIQRFHELNNNISLLGRLKHSSFSSTSTWVNELFKEDGNKSYINSDGIFYRNFKYFTVDGQKEAQSKIGKKLEDMSPADHEAFKLAFFFNQGNMIKGNRRIMEMFDMTISDKGLMPLIRQVGYHLNTMRDGTIFDSSPIWGILYDTMVQSEINRIIEFQANKGKYNIKGYDKGAELFYFLPELNELQSIWDNGNLKPIVKNSPEYKDIMNLLKGHVNSLVEQKKSLWRTYGFVEIDKNGVEQLNITDKNYASKLGKEVNSIANNYVINYLIHNANLFQTFIGDPALFFKASGSDIKLDDIKSTFVNIGVRLASHIAPGLDIPSTKGETFNTIFLKDREGDTSVNKEYLKTILSKEDFESYNNISGTDAQEYTTLKEHLNIMLKQGRINEKDYNTILDKEKKSLPLNTRQLKQVLQPMKLVYMNKVWDNGIEKVVYVKSSSYPLIKELTKGLEIDKLRVAMENVGTDRVAFSTAVKLGNVKNPIDIFNSDGTIKDNLQFSSDDINNLPRWGHRRQQEVPFSETKYTINDGTQQSKLLFTNLLDLTGFILAEHGDNLTGKELRDIFNDTYGQLFKIKYNNLMNSLTDKVKLDGKIVNKINMKKLQTILKEEGLKRNFSINDLQALNLIDKNGQLEFEVPLWATPSAMKFEALLSSIVDNRIRKRIIPGKSYVLGSEEGYRLKKIKEVSNVREALEEQPNIAFDKQWLEESGGVLRPMRVIDGVVHPDEVLLPAKFYNLDGQLIDIKQLVDSDGYIDTNRLSPELLEHFGFRIPTQGHNSMTYMKVVGFLPYESGDLIIAPRDFTKRMGSDFDVDKLYVMSYNHIYNQKDGTLTRIKKGQYNWSEEKELQNKLLDIHFSVLKNSDNNIHKQVHTPLGFGKLEELADNIDRAYSGKDIYEWSGISEEYQKNRYLSARGAKIGVGAFSLDNTFNSLLQGNDDIILTTLEARETADGKTIFVRVPYKFKLGGRNSNQLSDAKTNLPNSTRYKSEVISAFQSAAVDNEKVQLLNRLNINKYTFAAVKALNQLGFEEDITTVFINQPIIRKYVELVSLAKDSSSNWTMEKVDQELNRLFPTKLLEEELQTLGNNISSTNMINMMVGRLTPTDIQRTGEPSTNSFNDKQQALLAKFLEITTKGEALGLVQSTINSDSAGVGKDLIYSLVKEDQILNLIGNNTVYNSHKLIGDYWNTEMEENWEFLSQEERDEVIKKKEEDGYVKTKGQLYIKPTTINGYASVYGTIVNAKFWNKFFGYDSSILLKAVEQIAQITGNDSNIISVKADVYRDAWNFIKSYLMSQTSTLTEDNILQERQRLLYDTKDNISLASIVDDIKDRGLLGNNPFIDRLETEIFKEVLPSKLTYNSSLAEGQDERYIYAGFIDLLSKDTYLGNYNGIDYTTRTLAQDLVTHQYITGGVQRANQFIKYIPVSYLRELGYYDMLKGINLKDRKSFGYRKGDTFATTEQYIQHYPREVAQYDLKGYKLNENGSVLTIIDDLKFNNTLQGATNIYIALPNKNTKIGFDLYKQVDSDKYIQIDTLGEGTMRETDFTSLEAKSTVKSNQSRYSKPKTVTKEEAKKAIEPKPDTTQSDVKDVPPESERGLDYEYGLRENDVPGIKKIGNALNHIITTSDNKFYSWYAEQCLNNLSKLPEGLDLLVDMALDSEGKTYYDNQYSPTRISINPLEIEGKENFERVILHEITHAFTKQAIKSGGSEAVQQLDDLRNQFDRQVRFKYTSEVVDKVLDQLERRQRVSVNIDDARIIRATMNLEEFLSEAMSNKKVQNILDSFTPTNEYNKAWSKFKSLVANILEKFGFQKGKVLDHVVSNVISLIDTPTVLPEVDNQLDNRITLSVDNVNTNFGLVDENGDLLPVENPEEVVSFIHENIKNIEAKVIDGKYIKIRDKNIDKKFDSSISNRAAQEERQPQLPVAKLLASRWARIKQLTRLINIADANSEFGKAEEYKQQRQELEDSVGVINKHTTIEYVGSIASEDLEKVKNMLDKRLSESDILYALKITNMWEKGIDIFFDEDTLTSEKLRDQFKAIEGIAEYYSEILYNKLVNMTNKFIKKHTGVDGNMDIEKVMASMQDISRIEAEVLNASRNNNPLMWAIFNSVKKANYDAMDEAREIVEHTSKLVDNISPILKANTKKGEKYEIFRQKFKDGKYTGNLVNKFTPEFGETLSNLNKILAGIKSKESFIRHAERRAEKVVTLDVRKLFPSPRVKSKFTEKQIEDYKQELKDMLGEATYNSFMKKQERAINRYEEDREHNLDRILANHGLEEESQLKSDINAYNEFKIWLLQNSPYEAATQLIDKKPFTVNDQFITPLSTQKYLMEVPRKTDKDGKNLGFYDSNFDFIENNKDLLEFYDYITNVFDELKVYLPQEVQERIQFGGLPEISKTMLELMNGVKGGKEAMSIVWNELRKSVRTDDISDTTFADLNPTTGKADKFLTVNIMKNNRQEYLDYLQRKNIEWQQSNPNTVPPLEDRIRWKHEAIDMLAQKKSYDLGKVVKAYSMLVLGYKHKSRIEDQLKAAETILHRSQEMVLSPKKKPLKDAKGNIIYKDNEESFRNMKGSLEYFMDVFYGHPRKLEGITSKDILTKTENKTKEELQQLLKVNQLNFDNGIIRETEYQQTKDALEAQIDRLGGVAVWSKRGDNILKYIQLKVMGWNLFSGVNNVGFGWISNLIEAADGRVFNQKDILTGYKLVLHSIGKNLSFNHIQSNTATKIRSLMDRFDVLKDMSNELYNNSIPSQITKSVRWLAPYSVTQRTEYINQAPIMIALMHNIKTENGKTLWEQFDKEGNWIGEGEYPTDLMNNFRLKLDGIIEKTHGDYGSPLKIKEKLLGRAMSQFRVWMYEGFAQRFEPEKFDPNLGIMRKGRYISLYSNYFKKLGFFGGLADLATNILRKITFQGTKFDNLTDGEIFNEVDAANMRKVLAEMTIYMSLVTAALMLKMLTKGLDDDDDKKKYALNYLINNSSRLRTDILFYFNPVQFRNLLRDPVPAATLIKDSTEWVIAAGRAIGGDDIISNGVYAGESRLTRETMQLLPFGTQIYRNVSAGKTQY